MEVITISGKAHKVLSTMDEAIEKVKDETTINYTKLREDILYVAKERSETYVGKIELILISVIVIIIIGVLLKYVLIEPYLSLIKEEGIRAIKSPFTIAIIIIIVVVALDIYAFFRLLNKTVYNLKSLLDNLLPKVEYNLLKCLLKYVCDKYPNSEIKVELLPDYKYEYVVREFLRQVKLYKKKTGIEVEFPSHSIIVDITLKKWRIHLPGKKLLIELVPVVKLISRIKETYIEPYGDDPGGYYYYDQALTVINNFIVIYKNNKVIKKLLVDNHKIVSKKETRIPTYVLREECDNKKAIRKIINII